MNQCAQQQQYLQKFVNDWATDEIAKSYLKHQRADHKQQGIDDNGSSDDNRATSPIYHIDDFEGSRDGQDSMDQNSEAQGDEQ